MPPLLTLPVVQPRKSSAACATNSPALPTAWFRLSVGVHVNLP
jgi:hypothetical protein